MGVGYFTLMMNRQQNRSVTRQLETDEIQQFSLVNLNVQMILDDLGDQDVIPDLQHDRQPNEHQLMFWLNTTLKDFLHLLLELYHIHGMAVE